jgi:hypothetical protein
MYKGYPIAGFFKSPMTERETEFTIIGPCRYNGKSIKEAIGFPDNCRLNPELGALSNIPEELGTYIPRSSKIKTAFFFPGYNIRNSK